MELNVVKIDKPEDVNLILGQAHFIKTVEDLHEALAASALGVKFGLAFCESSGPCLVRGREKGTGYFSASLKGACNDCDGSY